MTLSTARTTTLNGTGEAAPHRVWTLVLASMGLFMTALDTLVVTTALPVLRKSLHANLGSLEWTVNAYNLAFACLLLTGAALGDRFGRRRMFAIGVGAFTVASAISAMSSTVGVLIAGRALQGAAAAVVTPLTLTLITEAFPVEKRGAAIGMWGGIAGLAVAMGPVIGGAIAGGISWHWIFWLNIPIGIALVPLALTRLSESFGERLHLDIVGLLLVGAGALGLTWGLIRANTVGWGSAEFVVSVVGGVALLGAFVVWEQRTSNPMLPLGFFHDRVFASANAFSLFMWAGLFGTLFLMAQFLQIALGHSPLGAGLRMLPWTAAPVVVAPLAGALAERYGNRPFMVVGMAMQAAGLAWIAAVAKPGMGYGQLGVALGIAGIGISMCFPTVANAVMGSVPLPEAGMASGANSMVREFGGVLGIAVLASVFSRPGAYQSPHLFINGFTSALWVGVGFSVAAVAAALFTRGRAPQDGLCDIPVENQRAAVAQAQPAA